MTFPKNSCYRRPCEIVRTTDNKHPVHFRQDNSPRIVSPRARTLKPDTPFGSRLRSVLSKKAGANRLSDSQIREMYGEDLGVTSDSGVANYLKGGRYPDVDVIIRIAQLVGCSLDYLLLGIEDPPRISAEAFSTNQRLFIEMLARHHGATFDDVVRQLVGVGLDDRARTLAGNYTKMNEDELRDMLDAVLANDSSEANNKPAKNKKRH